MSHSPVSQQVRGWDSLIEEDPVQEDCNWLAWLGYCKMGHLKARGRGLACNGRPLGVIKQPGNFQEGEKGSRGLGDYGVRGFPSLLWVSPPPLWDLVSCLYSKELGSWYSEIPAISVSASCPWQMVLLHAGPAWS